jgi:hypothetical protein
VGSWDHGVIQIVGSDFRDEQGRRLLFRGINLGGSSKVPSRPDGAPYVRDGFFDHRTVSFVGRPFPLTEADEHLARLRHWGFDLLRFLVTWEAIEHAGPGLYDEEYLECARAVVAKAAEHGFSVIIDPHQDVWSRFSGGDGAPGWTLEAVGFDLTTFAETGAAVIHQTHGDSPPPMIWPTNATKLAAATMFTLFFGGNDLAPRTMVNGQPVQEFLQSHYIAAIQRLAERLRDVPNVLGYDTMNEPLAGYIGWKDLQSRGGLLTLGDAPTPLQGMLLGAGLPQEVAVYRMRLLGPALSGGRLLNAAGRRAWREGNDCIWRQNGVWDLDGRGKPRLLRPDHFCRVRGRAVDFAQDYYQPFANRFAAGIRAVAPQAVVFLEAEPGARPPRWGPAGTANVAYAPHWYDGYVLAKKSFSRWVAANAFTRRPVFGPWAIRRSFAAQLARLPRQAAEELGGVPTVLGEFGIPFDLDRSSYRSGDFCRQAEALDRSFRAVEANLLSSALWNYTSDNSNARGDQWNDEDLSIFSRDQQTDSADPDSGGRALAAVVRPYPRATAGELLSLSFDPHSRRFEMAFRHDAAVSVPTEVFVPSLQYPDGCRVQVSDGTFELDRNRQTLWYHHSTTRDKHTIRLEPLRGL